jgi:hypothetical protein
MKISKSYIFLAATLSLASCSESFLDLKPISTATSDNFYRTADDFKNAVNGGYAGLQAGGITGNSYVFGEITSDNTVAVISKQHIRLFPAAGMTATVSLPVTTPF